MSFVTYFWTLYLWTLLNSIKKVSSDLICNCLSKSNQNPSLHCILFDFLTNSWKLSLNKKITSLFIPIIKRHSLMVFILAKCYIVAFVHLHSSNKISRSWSASVFFPSWHYSFFSVTFHFMFISFISHVFIWILWFMFFLAYWCNFNYS